MTEVGTEPRPWAAPLVVAPEPSPAGVLAPGRSLRVGGRRYPVVLPKLGDPRLRQSAVLISLQVLGQVTLGFELSIAQILLCVVTCAVLEVGITLRRSGWLVWPASALLTANGVALILRVPGTRHGDWWSLRGWWIFVGCAALSLLSKYVIRWKGSHVFNPSNFGLVVVFLALGSSRVDPQVLWWGPLDAGLAAAVVLILVGGVLVLGRIRLLLLALTFWLTFAGLVGELALSGHCMTARWNVGPVCGVDYWWVLVGSPEILVFALFMITDPRTTPSGPRGRIAFGAAVGALAALLVAPQRTEFATKVAVLSALAIVCAAMPLVRRLGRAAQAAGVMRPGPAVAASGAMTPLVPVGPWRPALRVATSAVVLVGLLGPLAMVAGAGARPSSFPSVVGPGRRPSPSGPQVALPPVEVDPGVTQLSPDFSQADAERMASDFVVDLTTIADATARLDAGGVAVAASGSYRDQARAHIEELRAEGVVETTTYHLERIRAIRVRVPGSSQNTPEVGLDVSGTVTRDERSGRVATGPPAAPEPFHATFRMAPDEVGDRYLIAGPGEIWTGPTR